MSVHMLDHVTVHYWLAESFFVMAYCFSVSHNEAVNFWNKFTIHDLSESNAIIALFILVQAIIMLTFFKNSHILHLKHQIEVEREISQRVMQLNPT